MRIISSIKFDWTWGTLFIRNPRVKVQEKMPRKSSLLCLRSNKSHSCNLIRSGGLFSRRRGSIRSQSGFKHGYQARQNLPKYMWSLVKEVSGKLWKRPFVRSSNDGGHFECYREFSRDVTAATELWKMLMVHAWVQTKERRPCWCPN